MVRSYAALLAPSSSAVRRASVFVLGCVLGCGRGWVGRSLQSVGGRRCIAGTMVCGGVRCALGCPYALVALLSGGRRLPERGGCTIALWRCGVCRIVCAERGQRAAVVVVCISLCFENTINTFYSEQ